MVQAHRQKVQEPSPSTPNVHFATHEKPFTRTITPHVLENDEVPSTRHKQQKQTRHILNQMVGQSVQIKTDNKARSERAQQSKSDKNTFSGTSVHIKTKQTNTEPNASPKPPNPAFPHCGLLKTSQNQRLNIGIP